MKNSTTPWKDERWLPGVLNKAQMISLMDAQLIIGAKMDIDEDASALDLHLSSEGYRMKQGSIKPFNKSYRDIITDTIYAEILPKESDGSFLLEKEQCYLFKIKEKLHPYIKQSPIYGQATAKSTVGRVDVIARLIVDGMKEYEKFNPKDIDKSGEIFLEITPINFNVKVKEGISISQLRFFNGEIENSIIQDKEFIKSVLNLPDNDPNDGYLSVDISNTTLPNGHLAAALRASKKKDNPPIELWGQDKYNPFDYWIPVASKEEDNLKSIVINKNQFYILRSKERISLPAGCCIYCRAMDETLGEMRIHYAGFVHPLFGVDRPDGKHGTPLIFEVRGHNVEILLTHNEILARLFFYRMSNEAGTGTASYNNQDLTLSKFFKKEWTSN
jgi:dCTP deaminase